MQDKYVGDIGDFGKYALLNFLAKRDVVLGVVWYLTSAECDSRDGGFTQYLSSPDKANGLGKCDEELFDGLREIVQSRDRQVARVREGRILPGRTQFYEGRLEFDGVPPRKRPEVRKTWFERALKQVEGASLVFLDPDNGLSLNEKMKNRKAGPKHVYLDEVRQFLGRGQSLVVYCHQDRRKGGLEEQIRQGLELFRKESPIHKAWAFSFHRQSVRIYFVVPVCQSTAELLAQRSTAFNEGCFGAGGHFRLRR
ncbi:MAG: hypothetical protein HY508_02510 [Acidobacteria bacterium]|nr:hypothetical protein [Acidobacteriota bacterium]